MYLGVVCILFDRWCLPNKSDLNPYRILVILSVDEREGVDRDQFRVADEKKQSAR